VSQPTFALPVADLERGPRSVSWVIPEAWLRGVLADTEAVPNGDGTLDAELSKNGREVMVRGKAKVHVTMPCVVTLDPLPIELEPEVFLLLEPRAPVADPTRGARSRTRSSKSSRGAAPAAPASATAPRARSKPVTPGWSDDPELSPSDAAKDVYDGEKVVLDDFIREFILLELPAYPRRSDLPSGETPAIAPPSEAEPASGPIDPRLMPLAAIASRLRDQKKE
jgi:uncharacterized metal-binding protein YceD (DUF177 family)